MASHVETATTCVGVLALIVACGSDGSGGGSGSGGAAGQRPDDAAGGEQASAGGPWAGSSGGPGDATGGSDTSGGTGGSGLAGLGGSDLGGGTGGAELEGVGGTDPTGGAGGEEPTAVGGASGSCAHTGDGITTLIFRNGCAAPVTFEGSSIESGELGPGDVDCRDLGGNDEELPSIRYWGYTGSDPGAGRYTLAELTLNTDWNDFDWYNLSHVDAHNLPMALVPVDHGECRTLSCPLDLLADCPPEGRWPETGPIAACVSPNRDDPNSPVAQYFEAGCADAYSWSGDDAESMAACSGGEDYEIVFCPSA